MNKLLFCFRCNKEKKLNKDNYYFSKKLRSTCKDCLRDDRRTIKGIIQQRWMGILQRCDRKTSHFTTASGKEHLSKERFVNWAHNKEFIKLYKNWKKNNFNRNLSPSIDRLDITKGYTLDNIQWITMRENNSKAKKDWIKAFGKTFVKTKKVRLWKENGEEMFFDSGKEASIYFNKNRLAVTNNIIMNHKLQGWNCEWIDTFKGSRHKETER